MRDKRTFATSLHSSSLRVSLRANRLDSNSLQLRNLHSWYALEQITFPNWTIYLHILYSEGPSMKN